MDQKWTKYSFVCTACDSLIEYTCNEYGLPTGSVNNVTCVCGGWTVQTAVEDATIKPNNEKKEDSPMNTTTTFLETRVAALEEQLKSHQNCDYWKSEGQRVQSQLIAVVNDFMEDEYSGRDIVDAICTIIDYQPVKTIEFTATMAFTGSIDIPMDEIDTFDLTDVLNDAYVDINNGNVVIDNYELYDANEC